ncbi:LysR family transcriptional regulator [Burkholderia gladioli]|uniref:LysR family transcriptional regulator n=1 Tax=Burkholderia gladioli TaxID=28095 RepID=A0A2A7S9G6_BURGA|nr:LysR family transcriptional regulator [Burkholderia gladioli pv. gladioli]AWY56886.1 LysR family transcriptional regulator [Burkholderia gladioli pv. gladioli]PEH40211.1 LysR family transcriptional regulator [Burkholderia gladioli]QPQ85331.1 LysR family transcriptional regulator [Burkholderia gladioli]
MKLNTLRDFIAVAERGGLRAAARFLGQPQPAISRSIRDLEKELGVALFERHVKGVRLTTAGSAFLRRANVVRNELQRARDEIEQMRGETHGRVTLCMSTAAHLGLLPGVLRPFRSRYPDINLEIIDGVYPVVEASLMDGTVDCYIGPAPVTVPGELQIEKLFDNNRVIIARRGHPLAKARSLCELVEAEWITTSITHRAEEELGPLFEKHGLPAPRLAMRAQSALTFMTALANSNLLMMLPVQWIKYPPLSELFEEIRVAEPLHAPPVCIVQRTGLPLTPATEYFCTLIRRIAT